MKYIYVQIYMASARGPNTKMIGYCEATLRIPLRARNLGLRFCNKRPLYGQLKPFCDRRPFQGERLRFCSMRPF